MLLGQPKDLTQAMLMASRTDNVMYNLSRGNGGDDRGPLPMELGVVTK